MTQPPAQGLYTTPTGLLTVNPPEILIGAGDIASCGSNNDELTALIVDTIPGTVMVIGDNVYENGTTSEFNNCYDPTWGRHKARTKPATGNHEYNSSDAAPYFAYFGAAAGDPTKGYYSYDLGAWHIIVLNSSVSMNSGSAQDTWLQNDLAAHPNLCTLSYFHHPLWSSGGGTGGQYYSGVRRPWDVMYPAGVDLILGGHRHFYERGAPMKPDATADPTTGTRQIIVGSGGIGGGGTSNPFPMSEVRNGSTFGVLKLYLYDDSYAWKFIPRTGQTFTDSGSTACHGAPGSGGGGVSASQSTVGAAPSSFIAGSGSSTVTVTARNSSGNPVSGANVVLAATGTGNTFTPPSGTTNGSGVFTSTFTSTGAGAKTISASANGIGIIQTAPVTVTAGPLSASMSTVTASPTSFVAGSGSSTITATAKDAFGNPISGATVVLASSGTGNTLTQPSGPTNSSGVATGSLASSVAELKTVSATINGTAITQTAAVNVTPAGPGGAITHALLTAGSNATNLNNYTTASISPAPNALITVAVRNHRTPAANSPTLSGGGMTSWTQVASVDYDPVSSSLGRLTVFRAMSATPGSGPITITFSGSVSNVDWIVSQWTGVDQSGVNGAGAIGQTGSARGDAVTALSVPLAAFGNANNVAYGAVGARLNAPAITPGSGFTEIAEVTPGENTLLEAQFATNLYTIQASLTSAKNAALLGIEIKAGGGGAPTVSASQSTVSALPASITAGGTGSTITVTARDASGTPISGVAVLLSATGTNNTLTPIGPTDASGEATSTLTSTKAEDKLVSAIISGVPITQKPTVTVTPAVASALAFTTQPSNTGANAPITQAVVVEVRDPYGNRVNSSASVTMAIGNNPSSGTLAGTLTQSAVGGVATFSDLAINNTGNGYALEASSSPLAGATSSAFNITPQAPSASLSTVVAATPSFTAGGSSLITITVRDGTNTPMTGVAVTLSSTVVGDGITQPSTTTDGSGVTTGTVSATSAGPRTITAVADGITLNQKPTLTVNAGPADAGQSSLTALPATITQATGTANITVTVRDQYGNPRDGSLVVLDANPTTGNTLTGGGATNSSGVATGTLSSTATEVKTISATADGTPITQTATVTVTPPGSGITHTLLTAGSHATNLNNYTTASISPAPNTLITVAVRNHRTPAANSPTLSGGGMTSWTQVASVDYDPVSGSLGRLTVFRAMSASPGSGPITITFVGSVSNVNWIVSQWDGVDQSGVNGAGAIGQTGSASGDAVTVLSVPLAAFGNANNVAYGAVGARLNAAITPGSGFTEIAEVTPGENTLLQAQWATNLNTIQATVTTAKNAAILGIEIKVAP